MLKSVRSMAEKKFDATQKKAKQADSEKRTLARRAREDHKQSLRRTLKTESTIVGMLAVSLQKVRDGKENVKPAVARSVCK